MEGKELEGACGSQAQVRVRESGSPLAAPRACSWGGKTPNALGALAGHLNFIWRGREPQGWWSRNMVGSVSVSYSLGTTFSLHFFSDEFYPLFSLFSTILTHPTLKTPSPALASSLAILACSLCPAVICFSLPLLVSGIAVG